MQYAKGIHTKEYIYKTAKQLMYENGYKKATYSMISKKAEVPVGLVNYYYKKQELLDSIYNDIIDSIQELIGQQNLKDLNHLQNHILLSHIMITQIFADPQAREFHMEITDENLLSLEVHDKVRYRQIEAMKEYPASLSSGNYYWYASAEYGARRELILQNKNLAVDDPKFKELRDLISTISFRIVGLPHGLIQENLESVNAIFNRMDYSSIHLLP